MARTVAIEIDIKGQKDVLKLTDAIKQTNKALKQTKKEINEATSVTERLGKQKAYDKQVEQLVRLKSELKGARQEQRNAIRDFEAAKTGADSYRALNAELVRTRQEFKNLAKAERDGAKGKALLRNISKLDKELKKIDGSIGQFQRNVGNYKSALGGLGKTIRRVFLGRNLIAGIQRIGAGFRALIDENKEANKEIGELDDSFNNAGAAIKGIGVEILKVIAKPLAFLVDKFNVVATSIKNFIADNETLRQVFSFLGQTISTVVGFFTDLGTIIVGNLVGAFTSIRKYVTEAIEQQTFLGQAFQFVGNVIETVILVFKRIPAVYAGIIGAGKQLAANISSVFQKLLTDVKVLGNQIDSFNPFSSRTAQEIEDRIKELREERQNIDKEVKTISQAFGDAYNEIANRQDEVTVSQENITKAVKDTSKATSKHKKTIKETSTEYGILQKRVEDATKAIQEQVSKGLEPTNQQINELKESTTELNAVNEQLKAILDELTPAKEENAKATKDETKATKDLTEEIYKLNQAQIESANQQGIGQARIDALRQAQEELSNLTGAEENAAQLVSDIKQRLADQLANIDSSILQQQDQSIQSQIDNIQFQKEQELSIFEGSIQEKLLLEQQFNTKLAELGLQQVAVQEQILKKDVENFKLAEEEKTASAEEEGPKRREIALQLAQGLQTLLSAFDQLAQAQSQAQIDELDKQKEARSENLTELQQQLSEATGFEKQYLEQKVQEEIAAQEEIDKKKERIQQQENQRRKESAIANAIIAGALAIVQGFAQLGPVGGAVSAIVIAATTALQIATISAQKFADGGIVEGASHANGGVKFAVGGRVMELEGGEAVINKKSTAKYGGILSRINQAGGGKRFANGGITPSLGAPSVAATTQIGTAVDAAQLLIAIENRTSALEDVILNLKVTLNTRDTAQDDEDKQVILSTISN